MKHAGLLLLLALAASAQSFDVASVKVYINDGKSPRNSFTYGPQGVTFRGCSLAFIIAEAWHVMPGRIIGPSSLTKQALWGPLSQGYDIAAKADHPVSRNQIRLMLQSLLNERFQLAMRRESKSGPVYKLVVAKGRPKLQPSDGGDLVMARGSDGFEFRNAELLRLASYLSNYVNREVIDDTGIEGSYNFS